LLAEAGLFAAEERTGWAQVGDRLDRPERRLGPKCKRPLKSGLDQTEKGGAMVSEGPLFIRILVATSHDQLRAAGSPEKGPSKSPVLGLSDFIW